jgi:hypothetical protein
MTEKGLLGIGICGTAVTALCCFTPEGEGDRDSK